MFSNLLAAFGFLPLVQTIEGDWQPGIGDPTFVGWLTVVAYFWAAFVLYRAYRMTRPGRLRLAWGMLFVGMVLLGINKQLDLQTLFTVIGRKLAYSEGWYERRRVFQALFIRCMLVLGVCGSALAVWLMRHDLGDIWPAAVGGVLLVVFVMIRAASFHHVDILLSNTYFGLRMNWLIELSGIGWVGGSAIRYQRRVRKRARKLRASAGTS